MTLCDMDPFFDFVEHYSDNTWGPEQCFHSLRMEHTDCRRHPHKHLGLTSHPCTPLSHPFQTLFSWPGKLEEQQWNVHQNELY